MLDLPKDWIACDHSLPILASTTQRAENGYDAQKDQMRASFSYPLQFELLRNTGKIVFVFVLGPLLTRVDQPETTPTMYFQVKSFDSWNRHCTEGYGFVRLPADTGIDC